MAFDNPDVCAWTGSSVEFRCSYSYPDDESVSETAWYKGQLINGTWKRVKLSDLPSFHHRFKYVGDLQHNCSLELHDLQDDDAGHYYFWFDTNKFARQSRESLYLDVKGKISFCSLLRMNVFSTKGFLFTRLMSRVKSQRVP